MEAVNHQGYYVIDQRFPVLEAVNHHFVPVWSLSIIFPVWRLSIIRGCSVTDERFPVWRLLIIMGYSVTDERFPVWRLLVIRGYSITD